MAITYVKTKDGKEYDGAINIFRPSFNYFTLFNESKTFLFDECESVLTSNERISINSPVGGELCDEMLRAKKDLDSGRKYGWTEFDPREKERRQVPYPKEKFEWEKRYE